MKLQGCVAVLAAGLMLSACGVREEVLAGAETPVEEGIAPPAAAEVEEIPALEQCDAAAYRPLVGTPVAAAALPAGDMLRVYGETDIITQEYLPQRTNVVYGADGLIARVYCG